MDQGPTQGPPRSPKGKIELTAAEREIAKSLETAPSLSVRDRIFLILVWRNLKKASPVSITSPLPTIPLTVLRDRAQKAGLFFERGPKITQQRYGVMPGQVCYLANNEADLKSMSEVWLGNHELDLKVYKEMGRMSGFSPKAQEVYDRFTTLPEPEKTKVREELTLSEEEKKTIFPGELYPFATMFYVPRSPEGIEETREVVQKWVNELKLVAPNLLKAYVNERGNQENF